MYLSTSPSAMTYDEYRKNFKTVWLDKGLHQRLLVVKAQRDIPLHELVNAAVEQWLQSQSFDTKNAIAP